MPHSHYLVKNIHFFNNGKNIKSCTHVLPNPFKFSTQHISLNSCTSSLVASYWANLWRTAELHFKKRRIFNESQRSVKLADDRSVPISLKARLSQRKAESRSIMAKNCFFFFVPSIVQITSTKTSVCHFLHIFHALRKKQEMGIFSYLEKQILIHTRWHHFITWA